MTDPTTTAAPQTQAPAQAAQAPAVSPTAPATPPNAAPGAGTAPSQSNPQIPAGYRLVPESEAAAAERYRQQLSGNNLLLKPLIDAGLTDAEQIAGLAGVAKTARERQVDLARLLDSLSPAAPATAANAQPAQNGHAGAGLTAEQVTQMVRDQMLMDRHEAAMQSQTARMDALAAELAGPNANPEYLNDMRSLVEAKWLRSGPIYEDGPLKDKAYRPMRDNEYAEFVSGVKKSVESIRAQQMIERGRMAGATTPGSPPMGNATGSQPQGGPVPFSAMSSADKTAYIRRKLAENGGGPVSQMTGTM